MTDLTAAESSDDVAASRTRAAITPGGRKEDTSDTGKAELVAKATWSGRFYLGFRNSIIDAIDPDGSIRALPRSSVVIVAGMRQDAIDYVPGHHWTIGANEQFPYKVPAISTLLRVHADEIRSRSNDPERLMAKVKLGFDHLIGSGSSLIVCADDPADVPDFVRNRADRVVYPDFNPLQIGLREFRAICEQTHGSLMIAVSSGGTENEVPVEAMIDARGRIRYGNGWVSVAMDPRSTGPVFAEIAEGAGKVPKLYVDRLLGLAHWEIRKPTVSANTEDRVPWLDEMPGIRRIRPRIRQLLTRISKPKGLKAGMLVHGAPGTGKTMIARTIAKESGRNLVLGSYTTWQSTGDGHLGTTLAAMRATFEEARAKQPALLFIDELDSLGSRDTASGNASYERKVINGFLELVDGFKSRGDVVLVGATNDKDKLDKAILRHGRFGEHIRMPPPDMDDVAEIVDWYLDDADLPRGRDDEVTGRAVSRRCFTPSGSTIRAMTEEAISLADEADERLSLEHFKRAMVTSTKEGIDDGKVTTEAELREIAIHEAGHAFAVHALFGSRAKIGLATVNPALGSLGHVVWEFEKGMEPRNIADKAAVIVVALAGRSAEILHGGIAALGFGAGGDLEMARKAAGRLAVHGVTPSGPDRFVDATDEAQVRTATVEWLSHLHTKTMELMRPHIDTLRELADTMFKKGDLDGEEVTYILDRAGVPCGMALDGLLAQSASERTTDGEDRPAMPPTTLDTSAAPLGTRVNRDHMTLTAV
jgi:hypothetical protein